MAEAANLRSPDRRNGKSASAFRTISEVAGELDVPPHVLRFWETKFAQIKPLKRGGGRRYYRPEDIDLLRGIRELLYTEGYTIKGVQKLLREGGVKSIGPTAAATAVPSGSTPDWVPGAARDGGTGVSARQGAGNEKELRAVLAELEDLRALLNSELG
ncbi:MAG: MerR family transcriptional regulator [Rhodospirillales bacterium]|nr:MerR family transcriptional regulator [Rhodospirillales bacterium]